MPDTHTTSPDGVIGYIVGFHDTAGWGIEYTGPIMRTLAAAEEARDTAQTEAPELCWHILETLRSQTSPAALTFLQALTNEPVAVSASPARPGSPNPATELAAALDVVWDILCAYAGGRERGQYNDIAHGWRSTVELGWRNQQTRDTALGQNLRLTLDGQQRPLADLTPAELGRLARLAAKAVDDEPPF